MTELAKVRAVVEKYIDATYTGDPVKLRECFHSSAVMNGYLNGELFLGDPSPFIEEIENSPSMKSAGAPYKAEITAVEVNGKVACATLKETGFAGTLAFTDFFHLLCENGEWKITSKTFTNE